MALNGGNSGNEGIRSFLGGLPGPGGPPTQNRRRGKNPGSYYGSNRVSEGGGRSYQGGYQPRRPTTGASGDGPQTGYHRNGDYSESQAHSPTDSHGSGRSGQVLASSGGYHQYPSKDYEHRGEFRQRGDHHHYNHRHGHQSQPVLEHVQNGSQMTSGAGGPTNNDASSLVVQPSQDIQNGSHFPPQQSQVSTPVLAPFPAPPPAQIQAHPQPFSFYGLHPNSQPMFGSLALCHIPFGINPSSVISPIVYTQIIGSGMITPGLPYNMAACPVPNPFMQPPSAPTGNQFIIQHTPQQGPQPYPQYHHHPYQQQHQFQMQSQAQQHTQVVHHHHNSNPTSGQHNAVAQPNPVSVSNSAEDCVVFDSSSLLNPDADAFFPPQFPPTRPSTAEGAPTSEQNTQLADLGTDDDPDVDSKITEIESVVQRASIVDDTGNDGGDEDDEETHNKSAISCTNSSN